MLRRKAKVSHTHKEKLVFSLKLLFTQAYVKVIKSGCLHSRLLVCGVFCFKSGCRHSNCKRHVQIHVDIFGGFFCIPWCSCCFSCNRSCKEAAALLFLPHEESVIKLLQVHLWENLMCWFSCCRGSLFPPLEGL